MELYCLDCTNYERYPTEDDLEAHIAMDHLKMLPYKCQICKTCKFPTEYAVVTHYNSFHGMQNRAEFDITYTYCHDLKEKRKLLAEKMAECVGRLRAVNWDPVKPEQQQQQAFYEPQHEFFDDEVEEGSYLMGPEQPTSSTQPEISEETVPEEQRDSVGPIKTSKRSQCALCHQTCSSRRITKALHANSHHLKLNIYGCTFCPKKFTTVIRHDIVKHIKGIHLRPNDTFEETMLIDKSVEFGLQLREFTEKCFPGSYRLEELSSY